MTSHCEYHECLLQDDDHETRHRHRRPSSSLSVTLIVVSIQLLVTSSSGASGLRISGKPCFGGSRSQEEGSCMFSWECIRQDGRRLGTCADGFLFGVCCQVASSPSSPSTDNDVTSGNNNNNKINSVTQTEPPTLLISSSHSSSSSSSSSSHNSVKSTTTTTPDTRSTSVISTTTQVDYVTSAPSVGNTSHAAIIRVTSSRPQVHFPSSTPSPPSSTSRTSTLGTRRPIIHVRTTTTRRPITVRPVYNRNATRSTIRPTSKPSYLYPPSTSTKSTTPSPTTIASSTPSMGTSAPTTSRSSTPEKESSSTTSSPEAASTTTPTSATTNSSRLQTVEEVCGRRRITPKKRARIVGGNQSKFSEWPWMVSLRQWKKNAFLHKCGAALLNNYWAITAAHCVENVAPNDLLLRLGEYDVSNENEPHPYIERRVQIIAPHPEFDPRTFEYDLALLRFYEPVHYRPNIVPICIPEVNETFVGKFATVTGWGRLYEDGPLPDTLQHVEVPVITNKDCETMYRRAGYIEEIPHIFICAGLSKGTKDSCEGDSGGPLVLNRESGRWELIGIISWGIGCALPNQPGVYTRITEFSSWINQIVAF